MIYLIVGGILVLITTYFYNKLHKKTEPVIEKTDSKPKFLKPGVCQCTHARCHHSKGLGTCMVGVQREGTQNWAKCACQIYIPRKDNGDDDDRDQGPADPSVEELEKLLKL